LEYTWALVNYAEVRGENPTIHDHAYRLLIERLIALRQKAGISQRDLATALGVSQPALSKIENFERRLDALELLLWVKFVAPRKHDSIRKTLGLDGR
jgi:DNA-binding XRE family transcriptional regulator